MLTDDDIDLTWEEWLALPAAVREPYDMVGIVQPLKGKCDCYFNIQPDDIGRAEDLHDVLEHLDGRRVKVTIEIVDT